MGTPQQSPDKEAKTLVEFEYGDRSAPSYERLTDWDEDVTLGGDTYESVPEIEIELPKAVGSVTDEKGAIIVPNRTFAVNAAKPQPHSWIKVTVRQIQDHPLATSQDVIWLYRGHVEAVESNWQGRSSRYRFELVNWKSRLDQLMGLPATHQCIWQFGKRGCGYDVEDELRSGTLTVIDGAQVTITGLPSRTGTFWNRGRIRRQGIEIAIRDWEDAAPTSFELVSVPPAEWISLSVDVLPGCERTLKKCKDPWDNEKNFMGFGRKIPHKHPNYEA